MIRTLLLFDGKMSSTERIADGLASLIGNTKIAEIDEAPEDLSPYGGFCFVFNFYGAVTTGKTRSFMSAHREMLKGRRIVMVGVGFSDFGYSGFVSDTERQLELQDVTGTFVVSDSDTAKVGYEICRLMRTPAEALPQDELSERIAGFIDTHNTLALATSGEGYIRCTPCEYHYIDGVFWLITSGGRKFRGIRENGNVSAAIFDPYTSSDNRHFLQFSAKAFVVSRESEEYQRILDLCGFSDEVQSEMPSTPYLIKMLPLQFELVDSDLEYEGYDENQETETRFVYDQTAADTGNSPDRAEAPDASAEEPDDKDAALDTSEEVPEETDMIPDVTAEEPDNEEAVLDASEEVPEETDIIPENPAEETVDEDAALDDSGEEPAAREFIFGASGTLSEQKTEFTMPSFMKPYLGNASEDTDEPLIRRASAPLPAIDMSVIAGIESGGKHRFDDDTDRMTEPVRKNPVKFIEPEEDIDDLEDDFDEDDSPVFESRMKKKSRKDEPSGRKVKEKDLSKDADSGDKTESPGRKRKSGAKEKRKTGLIRKFARAVSRMLLIEDTDLSEEIEDEEDE